MVDDGGLVQAQHCFPAQFNAISGALTDGIIRYNETDHSIDLFDITGQILSITCSNIICYQFDIRDPKGRFTIYRRAHLPIDIKILFAGEVDTIRSLMDCLLSKRPLTTSWKQWRSGLCELCGNIVSIILLGNAHVVFANRNTPILMINLAHTKIGLNGKTAINLTVLQGAEKEYVLVMKNERERQEWVVAFNRAMAIRKPNPQMLHQLSQPLIACEAGKPLQEPTGLSAPNSPSAKVTGNTALQVVVHDLDDDENEIEPLPSVSIVSPVSVQPRSGRMSYATAPMGKAKPGTVSDNHPIKTKELFECQSPESVANDYRTAPSSPSVAQAAPIYDSDKLIDKTIDHDENKPEGREGKPVYETMGAQEQIFESGCHLFALEHNGSIRCISSSSNIRQITASCAEAAAITMDGSIIAWAFSETGVASNSVDIACPDGARFSRVSCGRDHHLAISSPPSSQLYGWGRCSLLGMRGHIKTVGVATAIPIFAGVHVTTVGSAAKHTVAVDAGNGLWTWGGDGPWLGRDQSSHHFTPTRLQYPQLAHPVTQVACSTESTYILTSDGAIYSCGTGRHGRLGLGDCQDRVTLSPVSLGVKATKVTAGGRHAMVIAETGDLYGWGCNAVGQLGIGEDTKVSMLPVRINVVSANDRVRQVACAKTMTGVITQSGSLLVWGSLNGHQLSTTPKLVTMDHNFCGSLVDIVCGYEMALITAIPRQCDPSSPDQVTESAGQAESNCEEKSTQRKRAPPTSEAENCGAGLRETNVINNALTSAKINSLEQGSLWAQIRIESRSDYVLRVNLPGTSLSTLLSAVRAHIQQATDTTEFMFLFRNTTNAISFRQENSVKLSEIIVQENTDNIDMNTIYIRTMIGHNTASKPNIVARSTTLASTIPDKLMVCEVSEPKVIKLKGVSSHDERPRSASQLAKFFESDILDRKPSSALKAKPSISRSSVSKEMPITKQPIAESSLPIQSLKDPISLGAPALAAVAIDDISVRNAQASIQRKSSITAGKETSFHLAARPTLSGHTPEKRLPSRISSSSNLLQEKIEVFIEGTDTVIGFVFMPRIRTLKLEDLRAVINDSLSDRIPQEYLFMTDGAPISTKQESKFGVFGTVGNKAILRPVIPEKEQPETETLLKVFITIPNESRKILGAVLVPSIATTTMSDIRSQIIEDIGYQTSKPWCFVIDQYKINISEEPSQMLEEYLKNSYGSIVIGPAFSENSTTPKLERGNQKVSKSR